MRELLPLNNDRINKHTKLLLTRIHPVSRFHIRDMNHVSQTQGDRPPKLYFLKLLEWFVEEHSIEIANTKKQQTVEAGVLAPTDACLRSVEVARNRRRD